MMSPPEAIRCYNWIMTNPDSHRGSIDLVMQCRQQRLRRFPSDEQMDFGVRAPNPIRCRFP